MSPFLALVTHFGLEEVAGVNPPRLVSALDALDFHLVFTGVVIVGKCPTDSVGVFRVHVFRRLLHPGLLEAAFY